MTTFSFLFEPARRATAALVVGLLVMGVSPAAHAAGTWESTLQGRDLDGNAATFEAYYDTALKITWLADANYAKTSGYDADGSLTWNAAKTWADNLVVGDYSDWRLPTMVNTGSRGCDFSWGGGTDCGTNVLTFDAITGEVYSEMAHLYYLTLGNKAFCAPGDNVCATTQPGWGLQNTGPFSNVEANFYWSGLELLPGQSNPNAWRFAFASGMQYVGDKSAEFPAWAVRSGDVAAALPVTAVPEPQTYALMLACLGVLVAAKRRRT